MVVSVSSKGALSDDMVFKGHLKVCVCRSHPK